MGNSTANDVDMRFISKFSTYYINIPEDEALHYIYSSIIGGHLEVFSEEIKLTGKVIVSATLELYEVKLVHLILR